MKKAVPAVNKRIKKSKSVKIPVKSALMTHADYIKRLQQVIDYNEEMLINQEESDVEDSNVMIQVDPQEEEKIPVVQKIQENQILEWQKKINKVLEEQFQKEQEQFAEEFSQELFIIDKKEFEQKQQLNDMIKKQSPQALSEFFQLQGNTFILGYNFLHSTITFFYFRKIINAIYKVNEKIIKNQQDKIGFEVNDEIRQVAFQLSNGVERLLQILDYIQMSNNNFNEQEKITKVLDNEKVAGLFEESYQKYPSPTTNVKILARKIYYFTRKLIGNANNFFPMEKFYKTYQQI